MKNKSLRVYLCAPLVLALGLPQVSVAQDDDRFEEINVTATKREESIYDVALSMSAFEGDNLLAQGITDVTDVGKFVPNMNVTGFSAGHVSSVNVFIRGIGIQDHLIAVDPGVSVSVDGVYLGRQVGQNWNLANVERIEVLRGPQGTLYGRNSIGGAVNIITKTPGEDEGAKVGLEVGSRGRLNGDFYADWRLSDNSAMSFTGGYKHRDGLGDFVNLPNAGVEVGEIQEVFGRVTYRYAPGDNFSLQISADANEGKGGLRPYTTLIDEAPFGDFSLSTVFGYTNDDLPSDPYDNATGQANQTRVSNAASGISVTADWAFNENLRGKIIASTRTSEYKSGLDDDSLEEDIFSYPETGEADQTSVEFQVNGDFGGWDFVSGLFYFDEDGFNFQNGYNFAGFGAADFRTDGEIKSQAIFANFGFNVSDSLRIAAGARYTEDDKDAYTQCCIGDVFGKASFDEVSWDLSANWSMSNGLNVYGAIQSGYQSGQFPARPFCLFGDPNCFVATDNITAVNYELGIKGQPTEWLQMSAAVFMTDYSDLPYQVSESSAGGFSTFAVVVDQTSTGFEWESTMLFGDNFMLHATLGIIDVDVDRDPDTGAKGVAPLTPELTWSLSPEFNIPVANGGTVRLRADYSYRDEMYGEPTDDPARFTKIEDRSILNANIAYLSPDDDWSVALYGRNITDERYTNAALYVQDYILKILSNDASEFGVHFTKSF
ncbi:MAG: TonB-dependent receptor [Woeseiaceae bacterium]